MPPFYDTIEVCDGLKDVQSSLRSLRRQQCTARTAVTTLLNHINQIDQVIDENLFKIDCLMSAVVERSNHCAANFEPNAQPQSIYESMTSSSPFQSDSLNHQDQVDSQPVSDMNFEPEPDSARPTSSAIAVEVKKEVLVSVGSPPISTSTTVSAMDRRLPVPDQDPITAASTAACSSTTNKTTKIRSATKLRKPTPRHRSSASTTNAGIGLEISPNLETARCLVNGQVRYKCCGFLFKGSSKYTRHARYRHTGEKPHKCQLCQKGFVSSADVKQHIRQQHAFSRNIVVNRFVGAKDHRKDSNRNGQ